MYIHKYVTHHCHVGYSSWLPETVMEYLLEWNPNWIYLTIAQFVFVLRELSMVFFLKMKFTFVLWYYALLLQYCLAEPKIDPTCFDANDTPYAVPSNEHVYMISVLTVVMFDILFVWKRRNIFTFLIIFITLGLSSVNCYFIVWCTFRQNLITVLVAVVPTLLYCTFLQLYYEPLKLMLLRRLLYITEKK